MKTNPTLPFALLLTAALVTPGLRAEDEATTTDVAAPEENTSYESADATTVVYDQPVAYYASVVYQAPVIYNAPVYYIAAGAAAATVAYEAQCQRAEPEAPASTVVVVGGSGGTYSYSKYDAACEPASTVIQFGERGGWFGPRR